MKLYPIVAKSQLGLRRLNGEGGRQILVLRLLSLFGEFLSQNFRFAAQFLDYCQCLLLVRV
jgi:hypothetical protein